MRRSAPRTVAFVLTVSALLGLTIAAVQAQEPWLELAKAPAGAIDASWSLDPSAPAPDLFHLYRGDLSRVGAYEQVGDPDGRCSIPGADRSVRLAGEQGDPGNFYYLLTAVDGGLESTLGFSSLAERANDTPCPTPPADCGSRGTGGTTGTDRDLTMAVLGMQRSYHRHVPASYDPAVPTPLLVFYHGLGSNSDQALFFYAMDALADANGFIVLFPDSLTVPDCGLIPGGKHWDVCENPPNPATSQDIVFTRQMISETSALYNVCQDRIYTHGHSYGGFFSFYLATTLPDEIAAFAEHSGGLMTFGPGACWPRCIPGAIRPIPGLLVHSTDDTVVPYANSVTLDQELTANGHESYLITLTGFGHAFDTSRNQETWDWFMARPLR